jgi:L-asparaginase II
MSNDTDKRCEAHAERGGDNAETPPPEASPILVEATRGGVVESFHRGRACIVNAAGKVLEHWGDINTPVFPRSALKPMQALSLLETGAADALGVSDAEIALACGSHTGETRHTRAVEAWLTRMGLSESDLECGPESPFDNETALELLRSGEAPGALHNDCSGKHAGILATIKYMKEPLRGYVRPDHPAQQRILGVIEQMTGQDLSGASVGVDGCSFPAPALPLAALAYGMARFADPAELPERRADAVRRIRKAWMAHAYLIAGRNTFDTAMIRGAAGAALVKRGAEGMAIAVLPRLGLGIALKIDDGSSRARDVAMAALIRRSGAITKENWRRVAELETIPVMSQAGRDVGIIRPSPSWLPYGEF